MDIKVLSRYLGSNVAAGMAVLVVLGALTPDQSQTVVAAMHQIYGDFHDAVGAFAKIWVIVFPLVSVWIAKMGLNSSQVNALVTSLLNKASGKTPEAEVASHALIAATATLPQVQVVVTDKKTADAITSPSVVPAQG
jgi:hypothetical protein